MPTQPYTAYPQPADAPDTRPGAAPTPTTINQILQNPSLVSVLQQNGIDPYAYADQLAGAQSDLAYAKQMQQILAGLGSGGGGGSSSNPELDALAHQGVAADQAYNQVLATLAQKKSGLTSQAYQNQLAQLGNQGQANQYAKQLLGIQGENTKLDLSRLGLKDQDVADAVNKLGLNLKSLGYDAQDIQGAMQSLGLDKKQLGNAMARLGIQRQDIGVQKEQAGLQHEATGRNLLSDATGRGAVGSEGYKADISDNDKGYQQALSRLGLQEQGIGTQESDIGYQGQQLDIQGNKLANDLNRNQLQQQGVQTDIGTEQRQYQYNNADRQQVLNALKGLGIQTDQLNLKDSDIELARQALGIQNQGDQLQQYGDMAQINNQAEQLRLKDLGIGMPSTVGGSGGSGGAGTLAALQAGAQANSIANNINSITGAFGRQALGALGNYYSNQSLGSQSGLGNIQSSTPIGSAVGPVGSGGGSGNYYNPIFGRTPTQGYGGFLPPYGNSQSGTGGMSTLGGGGKLY